MKHDRPIHEDALTKIRGGIQSGQYIYSNHGGLRQVERTISDGDVRCAIMNGWHEKKKDEWKEEFKSWNYAIRGNS